MPRLTLPPVNDIDRQYLRATARVLVVGSIVGLVLFAWFYSRMEVEARAWWDLTFDLVLGVWYHLRRVLPQVRPNLADWATSLLCLLFLTLAAHWFLRWLYRNWGTAGEEPPRVWRLRWTVYFVVGVVLLFSSGIAAIGIVHQTGWLINSPAPAYKIEPNRPEIDPSLNDRYMRPPPRQMPEDRR